MTDTGPGSRGWERFGLLMAVIWLVYFIYPIVALVQSHAALGWVAAGWAGLVSFVVLYVGGFAVGVSAAGGGLGRPTVRWQWFAFAGLIAAALLTVPAAGASASGTLPFLMSFASYGLNRLAHWITWAASVAVAGVVAVVAPDTGIAIVVVVVLLGIINTVSTTLILRSQQAERLGLQLATSQGREAVARDVHDLLGHSLTVVRLKAQLARRVLDTDPERARREVADIEELAAQAIADVRATVAGTRVDTLADQLDECTRALAAAGIDVRREGDPRMLSAAQALTAGWILREATTNILRHAQAHTVTVRIAPGSLSVTDDGVGLDAAGARSGAAGVASVRSGVVGVAVRVALDAAGAAPGDETGVGVGAGAAGAAGEPGVGAVNFGAVAPGVGISDTEPRATAGNGIRGMRGRAAAAAATLTVGPCPGHRGTRVAVTW